MKKSTWITIFMLATLALVGGGCKCDEAKDARRTVMKVRDAFKRAKEDPTRWRELCADLVPLHDSLPAFIESMREARDEACDGKSGSMTCQNMQALPGQVYRLGAVVADSCRVVSDCKDLSSRSTCGLRLAFKVTEALSIIREEMVVPGSTYLKEACGLGAPTWSLNAPRNKTSPGEFDERNASRADDLIPAPSIIPALPAGSEDTAGSARI